MAPDRAPTTAPAAAPVGAPPLLAGTRIAWPTDAPGSWIAVAEQAGTLRVVAGDASGAVRDVSGARFEEEYVEVDDRFEMKPSGNTLIVVRSMAKLTEAYREVFLLVSEDGAIRVAQSWSGLEGERAPFEPQAPQPTAESTAKAAARSRTVELRTRSGKARLVAIDDRGRAVDVRGGAFTMEYDPDVNTVTYEHAGGRLVARMSTAENIADNCEALLVAPDDAVPRVLERWRGDCVARAPFERAQ